MQCFLAVLLLSVICEASEHASNSATRLTSDGRDLNIQSWDDIKNIDASNENVKEGDLEIPYETDVYWRPWKGEGKLPNDAFVAGYKTDEDGLVAPVYVAQAFFREWGYMSAGVQPAQIFPFSKSVQTAYSGVHTSDRLVEVLSTKHPEELAWVPINETSIITPDTDCVIAGTLEYAVQEVNLFIGRSNFKNELQLGSVLFQRKTMSFPDGNKQYEVSNFETLCYKKYLVKKIKLDLQHKRELLYRIVQQRL